MPEENSEESDGTTHFAFEHKVFSFRGCCFEADGAAGTPQFLMPMGDKMAAIPLEGLRREFNITDDSGDGKLLDIVAKGLKYVQVIRPNDAIPQELLDGSASWSVEERHRTAARDRVTIQLVTLLTGREAQVIQPEEIEQLINDPNIKRRVQEAFKLVTERLGLAQERKQEVIDRVEQLGHELSFIEGLREHFAGIKDIAPKVESLSKFYGNQTSAWDDLNRVRVLLREAITDIETVFEIVDAQTCEILTVLRSFDVHVEHIRDARDDLHRRFMDWDEIIEPWRAERASQRSDAAEQLLKQTYRFLSRKYPQAQEWALVGRA